mgnify:CR=1 FL=1
MIEFSTVETLIMNYSPLLVTIIGIIVAFIKMIGAIKGIKNDNKLSNDEKSAQIESLKGDMQNVVNQNYALKQQLKELLTKIDHIDRPKEG